MDRASDRAEIACSLSDEAFRERRALVRESLYPHVVGSERTAGGLRLAFADGAEIRTRVEAFVELERQCCGFLTFTMSPPEKGLGLTITGPAEAQELLDAFADWTKIDRRSDG